MAKCIEYLFIFSHEIKVHQRINNSDGMIRDEFGFFYCRSNCGHVFSTKATRNR